MIAPASYLQELSRLELKKEETQEQHSHLTKLQRQGRYLDFVGNELEKKTQQWEAASENCTGIYLFFFFFLWLNTKTDV